MLQKKSIAFAGGRVSAKSTMNALQLASNKPKYHDRACQSCRDLLRQCNMTLLQFFTAAKFLEHQQNSWQCNSGSINSYVPREKYLKEGGLLDEIGSYNWAERCCTRAFSASIMEQR